MLGFSRLRGRALGALLLLLPWLVLGTAATHSVVAAEDAPSEASRLLGEWNDLFHGFSYFSPDDDTGDHSTVTPFKAQLDASSGMIRLSVRSVSEQADMRYAYEFPLSDLRRTTLATDEFCDGCEKIPQGTAVNSIFIECTVGKNCVRYSAHRHLDGDWRPHVTDEVSHFVVDCPAESCGTLEETLKALARLYRGERDGGG